MINGFCTDKYGRAKSRIRQWKLERNSVFLVAFSQGSPVEEAKKVLLLCLTHMNKDWIFNIVLFGSSKSHP